MPISFSSPSNRDSGARGAGVTAVLGPTNTGKTHLAIERMLGHSSGIIGLPLRLLAREVYNKVAARAGADAVALVTGEEKIKPPHPRYWVSTVEAMPRDLDVAFLAIDEVQLGADLERGHVFTDRMLNRRGREETLILGAQTVRPMVERLLPGAHVLTRPRLSQLSFAGEKKITRLPRRTAIVAFSVEEVYAIAELIRRQRGGAAVVLGALSPRTRNAQVDLYQAGDVEYLVATDAIGMGLNLDIEHVVFTGLTKFDGTRMLTPHQVAARLGFGPIPEGATLLHDCEVRLCCRYGTGHVGVGTQSENMRHAVARGRAVGPRPGRVDVRGKVGASRAIQAALRETVDRSPDTLAQVLAGAIADGDPLRDMLPLFDAPDRTVPIPPSPPGRSVSAAVLLQARRRVAASSLPLFDA